MAPKLSTSSCCCLGVKCMCPKGKVCPSAKRDINRIMAYEKANNLTPEEVSKYRSSLRKSPKKSRRKSPKKSQRRRKSAKKRSQ